MRKLVICLLVFGLYTIQTVVGHMNSDPAPGRSPGPPVHLSNIQNESIGNNKNDNFNGPLNDNENVADAVTTTYLRNEQLNHNNNEPQTKPTNRERPLNGLYNRNLDLKVAHENDNSGKKDEITSLPQGVLLTPTTTTTPAKTSIPYKDDAINFQLTNENNHNSPVDNNNGNSKHNDNYNDNTSDNGNATTNAYNYPPTIKEMVELTPQHKTIDSTRTTHESLQHERLRTTIPAISTHSIQKTNGHINAETYSTNVFSSLPLNATSTAIAATASAEASLSSLSSSHTRTPSCHSNLNDFLNDVTVIEVDDDNHTVNDNNDSLSNATHSSATSKTTTLSSTSTLPSLLKGFKIQLQLHHDVFDTSTAFGINCGLLYKVRLTTTLPTSATAPKTVQHQLRSATEEMQNPTILQYTGDFFVETVSLISSQERGSFVTSTDTATVNDADEDDDSGDDAADDDNNNNALAAVWSSSDETLGNKLPISWFARSQHTIGNRQLENNANAQSQTNVADALTRNVYNSNANPYTRSKETIGQVVVGDDEDDDVNENEAEEKLESLEVEDENENVGNVPLNGFYKATKNGFKLKQRQLKQKQHKQEEEEEKEDKQHDTNSNNNKWHFKDNKEDDISSSLSSKASKKSIEFENANLCPSENTWQGKTKSNTNAAGGISTESLGLWLVNELCEQDDTIEFRVFFRVKIKMNNMNNNKNNSNDKSNSSNNNTFNRNYNNIWPNTDGNEAIVDEAQIVVFRKTFQFHIRKDCHLILRKISIGTLDYTILPLYCIDCTVHFPSLRPFNSADISDPKQAPPGMLVELQRLNVPCTSGGFIRFNGHKVLCGKLEELASSDRVYHFNVEDEASVQFYRNPMFSLSYKLVDYCYNVSASNESGEFYIRPSMKDSLECYFRIHLPYGNRILLRMVTNNDSDILPMPTVMNEGIGGDATHDEELYTIFTSQGSSVDAQVINLTVNSGNNFGTYSSSFMPYFKLPDTNVTNSHKLMEDATQHKTFSSLGLDSFGFLAASKANLQMAFSGTANCVGIVIKVFESDYAKWSHCVNNTKHMRGFILESSSNILSVHLFRATSARQVLTNIDNHPMGRQQMPAIYLSYQSRPLTHIVSNCAFGWIAMEQFCIAAIETSMTWHEAEKHCSNMGGHLVSVRNEQQQQTINELLLNSPGYTDQNAYWVGGSDKSYEGDFRWSDGLTFQYTNWFPGWSQHGHYNKQPNDDGLSSQDCIELRRYFRTPPGVQTNRSPLTNKYMWNDRDCSAKNYLICERAMSDDSFRRNWINDCNKTVSLTKEHPRASIWSPSFPRQYPDNANCFTTITAPAGYRIVIEFEELVIENEQGCTYDYLEITEPKLSESMRSSLKTTSSKHRYNPTIQSNIQNSINFNYNNPNLRSFRKRSSYDSSSSTPAAAAFQTSFLSQTNLGTENVYAPQNTDYNGYDLAQSDYQKLLQIYSSLYSPRNNFVIQTPDYPKGNPYYQQHNSASSSRNHHHHQHGNHNNNNNNNQHSNRAGQEVLPKRLCGDWSTKLKLLRYVSTGSYLGLHFVSDYSHHFGGYKAKTYMENTASECSNERLKPYNGSCYLFVSYPEADWWTAQQICRGMGAKLTSVASTDEHRFITSNIRNQIDYSPQLIYWLGAELEKNGQFEWTDDSRMSFQGWLPGQGQFDVMPSDATCLGLQWKMSPTPMLPSGLYWQSQKCNKVGGYVCKKPKESFGNFALSNFTVTGTEGRLISPAYPNTYPLNIDYWIHIKAPERTRIVVQFQKIDLEPQDECLYDFISVQDYDIVSKIILEPATVPLAMLMSDEQFKAYDGVNVGNDNDNDDDEDDNNIGGINNYDNISRKSDTESNSDDNGMIVKRATSNSRVYLQQQQRQQKHKRIRRSILRVSETNRRRRISRKERQNQIKQKNTRRRRSNTAKLHGHLQKQHASVQQISKTTQTFYRYTDDKKIKHQQHLRNIGVIGNNNHEHKGKKMKFNKRILRRKHEQHVNTPRHEHIVTGHESHHRHTTARNENPKRRRRKKSLAAIKAVNMMNKSTRTARYRRSTILNDDLLPAADNAQSFLPYVRWCGSHESNMSKFDFVSRSNEVMLNFHSDYSITGLGFAAVWKAIDVSGCPLRTLTSREGTIYSPNYPHFLLNNLNCAYVIQAPIGKKVWLEFIEFDFQTDAILEVDIGNGPLRPFRLADHLNDGMFVSLKEQLRIQFRTGQHPRGKGFQAIYHTVPPMERRERIINLTTNNTGYLYQLNYPHDMPENVDFTQHLVAPFGHNILLELHGVEFTENGCQDNNLLEIYDNYADYNGTKWQLCKFQNANFHTGSPPFDDNYLTTNIYGQHEQHQQKQNTGDLYSEANYNNVDNLNTNTAGSAIGSMDSSPSLSSTTVAEFLLRQHQQQQQYYMPIPPPPPPVYITSYLNTLYIRQRTTAKTIANLNCTIRLQWDNNYKIKLASGDKSVESCQPNPCQYNGKCVVNNGTGYCQCQGHFTGRFCGLNLCELEPCVFGKCELTTNNFKCQCQPGYMGTTCEQKQRPCADNPCEGRGICIEKNGGFFCRCYAWWEGHRCEKRMLRIPYKPLSERMLQEPFWLGLITVFVVLAVIGLVWCAKRHFPEKIEKLLAEEADRNRPPGSIHGHHHHTSLREQLQFTTAIPQTTVNNAPGAPRSIFNRLGIRKPSLLSLSSPNPIPGGGGAAARTFSLDDLLRPPPRRKIRLNSKLKN